MTSSKKHTDEYSGVEGAGWIVSIALAIAAACMLLDCAVGRAQPPPDDLPALVVAPCPGAAAVRAYAVEGAPGLWLPRLTAECMLGRLAQLEEAVPYVRLLETRLRLDDERNELHARQVALAGAEAATAVEALAAAVARAREAEEARDAWHRRPALWVAIGGILVVALEAAAIAIFMRLK